MCECGCIRTSTQCGCICTSDKHGHIGTTVQVWAYLSKWCSKKCAQVHTYMSNMPQVHFLPLSVPQGVTAIKVCQTNPLVCPLLLSHRGASPVLSPPNLLLGAMTVQDILRRNPIPFCDFTLQKFRVSPKWHTLLEAWIKEKWQKPSLVREPEDNPQCLPRSLPPGVFEAVSRTMTWSFLCRLGPVSPWICRSLPTQAGITNMYPMPSFLHAFWLSNSGLHASVLYRLICLPGPESILWQREIPSTPCLGLFSFPFL